MSCKQKRRTRFLLFVATGYFYTALVCCLVQSVEDFTSTGWERIYPADKDEERGQKHSVEPVFQGPKEIKSDQPGLGKPRPRSTFSSAGTKPHLNEAKPTQTLSWTVGNVRRAPQAPAPVSEDGYQADFGGFNGVQGKIVGLSSDSSPHFREWQAMRPMVECKNNVMTFTASGEGFTHLLVDREEASPISLFQLPAYCGYSVKASWRNLELMVPFDGCYITQENGSYVLPLQWLGTPLKLSCPVPTPSPSASNPTVFCSPYGMSIQLEGEEEDVLVLGALVNEAWRPLVSEHCAYRVASPSPKLSFFIPYNAPCITQEDNLQLTLILDDQDYLLSCPITSNPQFASYPLPPSSPLFPGEPQLIKSPDPIDVSPTPPPSLPPILTQAAQLPDYLHYPYLGREFPQVNQPRLLHPSTHVGLKKHQDEKDFLYPKDSNKYLPYPNNHLSVIVQTSAASNLSPPNARSWHQNIPDVRFQSLFDQYHQYMPFFYPVSTPAPTSTIMTTVSPATQQPKPPAGLYYHPYYVNVPHYPETTAAPVTQTPAPLLPTPRSLLPLEQPSSQHYHHSLSHPHVSLGSLYSYWADSQQKPLASHPGSLPTPSPTTSNSGTYGYPFYLPDLPTKEIPPSPVAVYRTCRPYTQTICGYHYYPYYFYYGPNPSLYQKVPQYTDYHSPITSQMPTTSTPIAIPPPSIYQTPATHFPHMQCLNGRMVAFLPFAHPDSIQVKDQVQGWVFLSTVSPLCGYVVKGADEAGVAFYSPLPGCHSQSQAPMTSSLAVRFWDLSTAQYRTMDLQCPYQSTPEPSVPVYPSVPPTPQTTAKDKKVHSVPKTEVYCSSHQMIIELPPGSISGIEVKDIKGNQMKFQEAPKYCGYSASKGKDGKIHLSFQLHSRCHMSVQGKMHIISIIYITENGRKEAKFSCPVFTPVTGQECNLPTDQRLPCGSGSVSPPQCLSMGCCFNKHPPACYYPMDECTVDRHFVFSVPADLTEPPLRPDLLVAASNFSCKPEKVTADYALFKVPMDGCGTHRVVVGKMVVYMLEVINKVQTISLNYGTITRDSPVRLLVECRYMPGTVLTVSYVVKTPSLGPEIHTQGVFGVQLRIAKDAYYSSYYPQYHQPLQMLLGKPLYLEVRLLNSPDPSLVLLVHFCVAYPRSGKSVWVLLYNGCPNPLDPDAPKTVPVPKSPSPHSQKRRFTITTFQFLPDGEFKDPTEEIYFMCSTELCSPHDGPCVEGCFGH